MKLRDLQDKIWEQFKDTRLGLQEVAAIVDATVIGVGFHVDNDGNICDPRPAPRPETPRTNGVRYHGQKKRR